MTDTQITKRGDAAIVEKMFNLDLESLPVALAGAVTEFARTAKAMQPDDLCFDLDLPAGTMHFRCYRRARATDD